MGRAKVLPVSPITPEALHRLNVQQGGWLVTVWVGPTVNRVKVPVMTLARDHADAVDEALASLDWMGVPMQVESVMFCAQSQARVTAAGR